MGRCPIGEGTFFEELLNVTLDPSVSNEFASYAFDDCGVPAQREFLIERGILKRGLGSLESQIRFGVARVANQRASSWTRPPIDRMANINVEPGQTSFADLISQIERGVYMESNRSWSIEDYRNKFQFGCEYARLVESGRLGRGRVRQSGHVEDASVTLRMINANQSTAENVFPLVVHKGKLADLALKALERARSM